MSRASRRASRLTTHAPFGSLASLALVSLLVVAPACQKKAPQAVPEAPTPAPAAVDTMPVQPAPTPAPRTDDVLSQDIDALNRQGYLKDAFFDYNQAILRDDARTALASDAEWLKRYPTIHVSIEGHSDERGTSEYNLALGQSRADAARGYLSSLGIDGARFQTVSYGKERPFCTDSTETCWQQNRRGHLVISAK